MKANLQQQQRESHVLSSNPKASRQAPISQILQRYSANQLLPVQRESVTGEDEILQGKFEPVQREEIFDEDEKLPVQQKSENKTGLPDDLKAGVENLSGYSMDDVRVHYNSDKPAQLQALAYAQGTDIHVASGQEKHLPHEAWHVVQQKQGRVKPTIQLQGVDVNDNEALENEADTMGRRTSSFVANKNQEIQFKQLHSVIQLQDGLKEDETVVISGGLILNGKKGVIEKVGKTTYFVKIKGHGSREFEKQYVSLESAQVQIQEKYLSPILEDFQKSSDSDTVIMTQIILKAQNFAVESKGRINTLSKKEEIEQFALECTHKMEILVDQARKLMEGVGTALKISKREGIVNLIIHIITEMKKDIPMGNKISLMGDFFGENISQQNFFEGNNRATYIMIVILGELFSVPYPSIEKAANRPKEMFPKVIKAQYLAMLEKTDK